MSSYTMWWCHYTNIMKTLYNAHHQIVRFFPMLLKIDKTHTHICMYTYICNTHTHTYRLYLTISTTECSSWHCWKKWRSWGELFPPLFLLLQTLHNDRVMTSHDTSTQNNAPSTLTSVLTSKMDLKSWEIDANFDCNDTTTPEEWVWTWWASLPLRAFTC